MNVFVRQASAILYKDLLTEFRSKERLSSMGFFSLLVLVTFSFAFTPGSPSMVEGAGGIYWVSVVFSGFLGLSRSFSQEQINDCMLGVLLAPADRSAIYIGKMLGNLITMLALQVFLLPLFAILLNVPLFDALPGILVPVLFGTFGFATIGTLFSAMSVNTRLKEAMLPMLTLPILVPMLLSAVESFRSMLQGATLGSTMEWMRVGVAFCGIFFVVCMYLFEYVVEE
jgi:heme exporter protein B